MTKVHENLKIETTHNYGDINPDEHGAHLIRWNGTEWETLRTFPYDEGQAVSFVRVYPDWVFESGDYRMGFTDDMISEFETLPATSLGFSLDVCQSDGPQERASAMHHAVSECATDVLASIAHKFPEHAVSVLCQPDDYFDYVAARGFDLEE